MDEVTRIETLDLPVNQEIAFTSPKNKFKKRIKKRQLKLLDKVGSFLKPFLKPEEEILLVTTGCSPTSWLEMLTTGWIVFYLKRCLLVFTNQRILHLPTRWNYAARKSLAQLWYGDIETLGFRGLFGRSLVLTYKNGQKEKINYLRAADLKKLKTILPSLLEGASPSEEKGRVHLCPRCTAPLEKDHFFCPTCQLRFKDRKQATKVSLIFPGGGYFYTRHPIMGLGDAVIEGALLLALVVSLAGALGGGAGPERWPPVMVFAVILGMGKLVTVYHVRHYVKEYIPAEDFLPYKGRPG